MTKSELGINHINCVKKVMEMQKARLISCQAHKGGKTMANVSSLKKKSSTMTFKVHRENFNEL